MSILPGPTRPAGASRASRDAAVPLEIRALVERGLGLVLHWEARLALRACPAVPPHVGRVAIPVRAAAVGPLAALAARAPRALARAVLRCPLPGRPGRAQRADRLFDGA